MIRRPPGSKRTYTLFPDTTLFLAVILLRTASIDSMQAMEQVNHSQQVEAQSYALIYDLRNVEAAALAIAAGVDARELPDRIEQSRERIAPALDTLQALTRDNPEVRKSTRLNSRH